MIELTSINVIIENLPQLVNLIVLINVINKIYHTDDDNIILISQYDIYAMTNVSLLSALPRLSAHSMCTLSPSLASDR